MMMGKDRGIEREEKKQIHAYFQYIACNKVNPVLKFQDLSGQVNTYSTIIKRLNFQLEGDH